MTASSFSFLSEIIPSISQFFVLSSHNFADRPPDFAPFEQASSNSTDFSTEAASSGTLLSFSFDALSRGFFSASRTVAAYATVVALSFSGTDAKPFHLWLVVHIQIIRPTSYSMSVRKARIELETCRSMNKTHS